MTRGIVTLELPGDPETARLTSTPGRAGPGRCHGASAARLVFLLLYPLAFSTSAALLATRCVAWFPRAVIDGAAGVAGRSADAIENLAILKDAGRLHGNPLT